MHAALHTHMQPPICDAAQGGREAMTALELRCCLHVCEVCVALGPADAWRAWLPLLVSTSASLAPSPATFVFVCVCGCLCWCVCPTSCLPHVSLPCNDPRPQHLQAHALATLRAQLPSRRSYAAVAAGSRGECG